MMNLSINFYYEFYLYAFEAWYDSVLSKYEGKNVDVDSFLAYIGGGEL